MPPRETIHGKDPCELAARWGVREDVMARVVLAGEQIRAELGRDVWIISGFRTEAEQRQLDRAGRPTAPPERSTHLSCPATGVDLSIGVGVTTAMKAHFGRIVVLAGLRWGGGSPVDPSTGVPSDWNHVDVGPR